MYRKQPEDEWTCVEDLIAYWQNRYDTEPQLAEYTVDVEEMEIHWKLLLRFETMMKDLYARGEEHSVLAGHCSGYSAEVYQNQILNPRRIANSLAEYLAPRYMRAYYADVIAKILAGQKLDRRMYLGVRESCFECGGYAYYGTDGETIVPIINDPIYTMAEACPYPNGIGPFTTEFPVPSGQIICADDLRAPFCLGNDWEIDINMALGRMQESLRWAAVNVVASICGQCFPNVYRRGNDLMLAIGNYAEDDAEHDGERMGPEGWETIGSVSQDLCWAMFADRAEFEALGGKINSSDQHVIDVRPGIYKITHYEHDRKRIKQLGLGKEGQILTELVWDRDL